MSKLLKTSVAVHQPTDRMSNVFQLCLVDGKLQEQVESIRREITRLEFQNNEKESVRPSNFVNTRPIIIALNLYFTQQIDELEREGGGGGGGYGVSVWALRCVL